MRPTPTARQPIAAGRRGTDRHRPSALVVQLSSLSFAALLLAAFLTPYAWWRLSASSFVTLSDGLFVVAALLLLPVGVVPARQHAALAFCWLAALFTLLGGLLVGSIQAGATGSWLTVSAQYLFAYVLVPALMILPARPGASDTIAAWTLAGVVAMEAVGALLYLAVGGSSTALAFLAPDFISGARRLGSFANEANWNGAIVAMTLPLLLWFGSTRRIGAGATLCGIVALLAGLVLAASVTALTAALVAATTFCLVSRTVPRFRFVVLAAAAAAMLYLSGDSTPIAFQRRVAPAIEAGDVSSAGTFTGRADLIREAWGMAEDTVLVGVGVDQYRVRSALGAPVHNMYLLVWVEGGLLALAGWLAMLGTVAVECAATVRLDRHRGAVGWAVLAAFVVISTAAPHMYARLWVVPLVVAMAVTLDRRVPPAPPSIRK